MFKQYRNNSQSDDNIKNGNKNVQIQYCHNFIQNWTLEKFNSLPLIQRITMINQANKIIQAYSNYIKSKGVSKIYKFNIIVKL